MAPWKYWSLTIPKSQRWIRSPVVAVPSRSRTARLRATQPVSPILSHRIAAHLDAVRVGNQPIKNTLSQFGIANLLMPAGTRQLRGQNGPPHLIPVFADLPEVAALRFGQGGHSPVIDDEDIDA